MKKLMLVLLMSILLINVASASVITTHSYHEEDMKVEFRTLGLLYKGDITLASHEAVNEVITFPGGREEVTMFYDMNWGDIEENGLGKVYFTDMHTGKEVEQDYSFVRLENVTHQEPVYKVTCNQDSKNVSNEICTEEVIDYEEKIKEEWVEYKSNDIPKGNARIGVQTYVDLNEHKDAVWTIAGDKVTKHAEWNATLDAIAEYCYDFEGGTAATLEEKLYGVANGTKAGTVINASGIVIDGWEGGGANADLVNLPFAINLTGNNKWALNMWIKPQDMDNTYEKFIAQGLGETSDDTQIFANVKSASNELSYEIRTTTRDYASNDIAGFTAAAFNNTWVMITGNFNGSSWSVYLNGVLNMTDHGSSAADTLNLTGPTTLFSDNRGAESFHGVIDEVVLFNDSLTQSQITQLYNGAAGITCTTPPAPDNPPTPSLDAPVDYYNSSVDTFILNYSCADDRNVTNVSLYVDSALNLTTQWGTSNDTGAITTNLSYSEGSHTWNVTCYDNATQEGVGTARTFTIDTVSPVVSIITPVANINDGYIIPGGSRDVLLNWSAIDATTSIDTCWFLNITDNTNVTVTCGANQTVDTNYTSVTYEVYANDTVNNVGTASSTITVGANVTENSLTYDTSVTEGQSATFVLNLSANGLEVVNANLSYNGTEYTTTKSGDNSEMTFTRVLAPSVLGTIDFFFNVSYGSLYYNSSNATQDVVDINLTTCSAGKTMIFNFTVEDEETQVALNVTEYNVTIEVDFELNHGNGSLFRTFSANTTENPFAVCVENDSLNDIPYYLDAQIKYNADDYEPEYYHIQNYSLTNITAYQNVTLYDLLTADSQAFELIVRDSSFLPVSDALVEVYRKYINEGEFTIVEIPKTDEGGSTIAHLVLEEIVYNFRIIKFGTVIGTFNNVRPVCQNPTIEDCEIDFDSFASELEVPDFETEADFEFTLGYDDSTRTISSVFNIPSGTNSLLTLNVTQEDILGTSVCTDSLTSTAGTLSCIVPATIGNSTVNAKLYRDTVLQSQGNIKLDQDPADIYVGVQIFLAIFVMLTLVGAGLSDNPIFTVLLFMVGVILLFAMNLVKNNGFFGATATILALIIGVVIVIIKAGRRN